MAFDIYGLKRFSDGGIIGSGAGSVKGLFHYATNETHAAVTTGNFFNGAAAIMPVGSIIWASVDLDGTPQLRTYMVTGNTGSVVTIAEQTITTE